MQLIQNKKASHSELHHTVTLESVHTLDNNWVTNLKQEGNWVTDLEDDQEKMTVQEW